MLLAPKLEIIASLNKMTQRTIVIELIMHILSGLNTELILVILRGMLI